MAVVGGGIIGCAVAYYLARAGARVAVLERDQIAAEASSAAAGMLAPLAEGAAPGPFLDLALASLSRFGALAAELRDATGIDVELITAGLLRPALDDAEAADYRASLDAQRALGLPLQWLDAAEARALEPLLTPDVRGALYSPAEHQVNPARLTTALARAAAAHGATFRLGAVARGLLRDGDRVVGVRLADSDLPADHVVLAAGAWAAACGEWLGTPIPITPIKGQMLAVSPAPGAQSNAGAPPPLSGGRGSQLPPASVGRGGRLSRTLYARTGYLVPKADGTIYVGATVERAGYDRRVTAAGASALLDALKRLAPALADATLVRTWAGLRPGTPDHLPILGPVPGYRGVTLATGHYRNGILLAPITGELIAQAVLGQPTTLPLAPFSVERFVAVGARS
ncbi:MAG TPA: FAD-dependent oxidoreductase [Chloroflexota bacterium]|nr:FAD-dependent oxidoreductase [Chloroflexota bacterium]